MKNFFDVVIGNPPYQQNTQGSVPSQALPIYHRFIDRSILLNPRFLTMICPARWLTGGFGLDTFRKKMLNDPRIRILHDFHDSKLCFPHVQIEGGVCYFLWDRDYQGLCRRRSGHEEPCKIITHKNRHEITESYRPLLEQGCETFIRFSEALPILHKVCRKGEERFIKMVSPRDPFGLNYYEQGREMMFKKMRDTPFDQCIKIYTQGWQKKGISYADRKSISTRHDLADRYKVYISKAYGTNGLHPHFILNKPFLGNPETICNMTYLTIGNFTDRQTAEHVLMYIKTRFFRFMVSLLKHTQNAYRKVYALVPMQDFTKPWADEKLYRKYGITKKERAFIESIIREML